MVLEKIEHENDIKRINKNELPILAEEIRSFLIDKISKTQEKSFASVPGTRVCPARFVI